MKITQKKIIVRISSYFLSDRRLVRKARKVQDNNVVDKYHVITTL